MDCAFNFLSYYCESVTSGYQPWQFDAHFFIFKLLCIKCTQRLRFHFDFGGGNLFQLNIQREKYPTRRHRRSPRNRYRPILLICVVAQMARSLLNFRALSPTCSSLRRVRKVSHLVEFFIENFRAILSFSLSRLAIRRIDRPTTMRQRGASIYLRAFALPAASLVPICIARRDNCE